MAFRLEVKEELYDFVIFLRQWYLLVVHKCDLWQTNQSDKISSRPC